MKPGKKEKIRFGKAPQETLPELAFKADRRCRCAAADDEQLRMSRRIRWSTSESRRRRHASAIAPRSRNSPNESAAGAEAGYDSPGAGRGRGSRPPNAVGCAWSERRHGFEEEEEGPRRLQKRRATASVPRSPPNLHRRQRLFRSIRSPGLRHLHQPQGPAPQAQPAPQQQ